MVDYGIIDKFDGETHAWVLPIQNGDKRVRVNFKEPVDNLGVREHDIIAYNTETFDLVEGSADSVIGFN